MAESCGRPSNRRQRRRGVQAGGSCGLHRHRRLCSAARAAPGSWRELFPSSTPRLKYFPRNVVLDPSFQVSRPSSLLPPAFDETPKLQHDSLFPSTDGTENVNSRGRCLSNSKMLGS